MLLNYLRITLRNIRSHRAFSFINIAGLTIGISCCLLIILFVNFELGFDRFHEKSDNIYRVVMRQPGNQVVGSSSDWWVVSPAILKPTWEADLPDISMMTRVYDKGVTFKNEGQLFRELVHLVDPEFLSIFTFPLVSGDPSTALNDPYSILVTQEMAVKHFGNDNPVGQSLITTDGKAFKVTGVLKHIPENSHLKFDFLLPFEAMGAFWENSWWEGDNWLNNGFHTYLTLPNDIDLDQFDRKLRTYDQDGFNDKTWSFHVQPLHDIHFNRDIGGNGDKAQILIFYSVGVFILLIACFNYMNLSTAQAIVRAKEIGVRKVVGATRAQLIRQFLGESFILTWLSFLLSVLIVWLVLPAFNTLVGQEISFDLLSNGRVLLSSVGVVTLVALLSGSYSAFFLSSLRPVSAMKGKVNRLSSWGTHFRKVLVVIQFAISTILIIGTLTIYNQLDYMRVKNLGFDQEHIVYLSVPGSLSDNYATFKTELLKHANIVKAAGSSGLINRIGWSNVPAWTEKDEGDNPFFYRLEVEPAFFDLYGLEIEEGRKFTPLPSADRGSYILNKAAVDRLGFDQPIGERFGFWEMTGTVLGVVEDFHFESLHKPITPLGIGLREENFNYLSLKISAANIASTLDHIEEVWAEFVKDAPFEYAFVDERIERMYNKDRRMAQSFNYFSAIAIFISCLGILGMISFNIRQRTKEIGIRKVLGANIRSLLHLLTKETILIVLVAIIVAYPIAWKATASWLDNFAYQTSVGYGVYLIAGLLTLIIAIIPMCLKLIEAIKSNPVESLRHE